MERVTIVSSVLSHSDCTFWCGTGVSPVYGRASRPTASHVAFFLAHYTNRRHKSAFTLIEILVVVAIIALLIAIAVPSLKAARHTARMTVDRTNLKEIGNMTASYQATFEGHVPVLFNYYAWGYNANDPELGNTMPARTLRPSVALRQYYRTTPLAGQFNSEVCWDEPTRAEYEAKQLHETFVCPFMWGQGSEAFIMTGSQVITGPGTPVTYTIWEWFGRHESYHPWLWEEIVAGETVRGDQELHPNDPREGRPKYSALTWNRVLPKAGGTVPSIPRARPIAGPQADPNLKNMHRKWSAIDAQRRKAASMADVTILYCAQGNFLAFDYHINNPGSHKGGAGQAGTNTLFGDFHVDWVPGSQIGWP